MLSVFDRIKQALANEPLSKRDLFKHAELSTSDEYLFKLLLQNGKLIPIGERSLRKYSLPAPLEVLPLEGMYLFKQKGDGKITFTYELEETITFESYDECVAFIKRRLLND